MINKAFNEFGYKKLDHNYREYFINFETILLIFF